jgi:purine nucleosidase
MRRLLLVASLLLVAPRPAGAAPAPTAAPRTIVLDTDIGDDIDDAFALAMILASPSLHLAAVSTSMGDTALRARLTRRFLRVAGRADIPVMAGPSTAPGTVFTQADWARAEPSSPRGEPDAVRGMLDLLRRAPDRSVTLVALAPLTTVGAMIARDPATFRRLAGVVMMGGSIARGYGAQAGTTGPTPSREYNIEKDPAGLRALLGSGVPVTLFPVDSTEIALERDDRAPIMAQPTGVGRALAALYALWKRDSTRGDTPVLFDVVPVASLLRPQTCKPSPLRLRVDDDGMTVSVPGPADVSACLTSDRASVLSVVTSLLVPDRREAGPGPGVRRP